jgi:Leucine-rich repeat (LRR) protein
MENSTSSDSPKEKKVINTTILKYRDYYTGDYYLKICLTSNNELLITTYNIKKLDAIKFSLKLNIGILQKSSNLFKKYEKIEIIYDLLLKIIDEKKFKISNNSNKIIFSIMPNNYINNNKEILLNLNREIYDTCNDYYKVLSDEICQLRKIINMLINADNNNKCSIKENSNIIQLLKEENIAMKEEINFLKQMIKNNDNTSRSISLFRNENENIINNNQTTKRSINMAQTNRNKIAIVEFNKKYNTDIKNNQIKELKLRMKKLGSGVLKYLAKLELNQLEVLDLSDNNISDINSLEKLQFNQLQSLSLDGNNIIDISALEKANFPQLQGLFLFNNKISDISILEKVNFPELQSLYLYNNKISDISILEKTNFPYLESLNLYGNNISNINVLEKVNFKKLQFLSLHNNDIKDISVFEKVKFNELQELYLYSNKISDISVFNKVNFTQLQKLDLHNNKIVDISVLDKIKCNQIFELYLNNNLIKDISVLERVNFNQLQKLSLHYNKINDLSVFDKAKLYNLHELYLDGNNIDTNKYYNTISILKTKIKDFCV